MPGGFQSPGVLFAGNSAAPDRRFYKQVLAGLNGRYKRYVEVGVGAFAACLVAEGAGWKPSQMETSDVTLYSSIVGTMLDQGDLRQLDMRINGEPLLIPDGSPTEQAAFMLWTQLLWRMEAKRHIAYWAALADDLQDHEADHLKLIEKSLLQLAPRLRGIRYTPMDMWDHLVRVVDDPETLVLGAPPSYKSGFETFFNSGGVITWNEPKYDVFDPATDMQKFMDWFAGKPALLMFLQEGPSGTAVSDTPVYARQMGPGWTAYVVSNRPEEIFGITGGPKVAPRNPPDIEPAGCPPMPLDYQFTAKSELRAYPVPQEVADYYRGLWMHRLAAAGSGFAARNLLFTVDGFAAGVAGYSTDTIVRPYSMESRWERHLLMRFAFGAPHETYRLTRLATLAMKQRAIADVALGQTLSLYLAASEGLVTVEYSRYPESKGLRGLMQFQERKPHPDGWQLTYSAKWQDLKPAQVLAEFLRTEARWAKARQGGREPAA